MKANDLSALQEMEKKMRDMIQKLSDDLSKAVASTSLPGVTPLEGTSVRGCTVSAQALFANPQLILAPSYYIPAVQAEAVKKRLESCKTVSQLCSVTKEMLETKRIRNKEYDLVLNPETLRVIQESELGQYVLSQDA
jgi:hypothetical protein